MARSVRHCIGCGDEREIVSGGYCSMCNSRRIREEARDPERVMLGELNERNKMFLKLGQVKKLVDEIECYTPEERAAIKLVTNRHVMAIVATETTDVNGDTPVGGNSGSGGEESPDGVSGNTAVSANNSPVVPPPDNPDNKDKVDDDNSSSGREPGDEPQEDL
jgi:hypothetical protein